MDLDDLDEPSKPVRVSRFFPRSKNAPPKKPKPEPALKPDPEQLPLHPKAEVLDEVAEKKGEVAAAAANVVDSNGDQPKANDDDDSRMEIDDNDSRMEIEDNEDDVVREIDVFLNRSADPSTQLYVMQYPLRPRWRPYEMEDRCEEIRVKPSTSEMEVDLSVDLFSKNCDQDFANKIKMTKQTLATEWEPCRSTCYVVGVMMGNKLHLNPVNAVVQLRPSLDHLKPGGSKRKGKAVGDAEVTVKRENISEEKSVGPSKKQNKRVEPSTEDEENWVPLQYHGSESEFSARYLKKMVVQDTSPMEFAMSPCDYVNSLCPRTCKDSSKRALLNLPLEGRIQKLLVEEPVTRRFSDLKKYYAPRNQEKELLDVLQKNGLLLRGLWIPKTALLYPKKESSFRKKEDDNLRTARNYILNSLQKNPVIKVSELDVYPSLKPHFGETLKFLAVYRPSTRDWKMKQESDVSFAELYPEIFQFQEQIWERMDKQLVEALKPHRDMKNASMRSRTVKSPNSDRGPSDSARELPSRGMQTKSDERGPSNSAREVPSRGVQTMSDETQATLLGAIKAVFRTHKVCSIQVIRDGLVSLNTLSKIRMDPNDPQEVLKGLLTQIAIEIGGVYVLKSSQEHPEHNQLRSVVIKLLQGKNKGPLKRMDVAVAAQEELGREMTNNEYTKVMNELCVSKGSQWHLKSGDLSEK